MWLIGMMGSGKTTVGEKVATTVEAPFFDTDRMIEDMTGMTVAAVFDEIGESGFRNLERDAVAAVPTNDVVAAAGGGAVLDSANRERMSASTAVIWLRARPDTLAGRVPSDGERPLLLDTPARVKLTEILKERTHLYEELATDVIDTDDRTVEDIVADLVGIWRQ